MNQHDLGYTKLFSHPRMIQDLVAGFIQEEWVAGLDFSTLEKVNPVYVTDDFRKRIDDLVWKIRWQGTDRWLLIYLILEPQSTMDALMALRHALYELLLYQDLLQSGIIPAGQKFPPVAPIVLYNGKDRWTAARDVSDLIEESPPGLEAYRPHMRYLLVDEHRYQHSDLVSMQNAVAALFRLEKSRSVADVRQVVRELILWLQDPQQQTLRRTFANWLSRILLPRLSKKNSAIPESIPEMNELEEVHAMLAETAEGWTREWKQEGLQQGLQQGRQQGRQEGRQEEASKILLRQLTRRFGDLSAGVREKINAAGLDDLELWSDRVLDAHSLADVLGHLPVDLH
ncbi:MAG: Rpn family recombination-promoting nuclease/putative transposase [Magnetococcales bacterium]|nr:Rpn family recombination-promoting nuclease/putative transposase [Magnetococcales bacterium]